MATHDIKLTHPLKFATITVHTTRGFRVRAWLSIRLIWLAAWISGAQVRVNMDYQEE